MGGPEILVSQHMLRRPQSVMAAQYSLPYALGASIVYGPGRYEGYEEERLADPRILALADRVDAVADDAMQAAFPVHFGSWVELAVADGTRRRTEVLDSRGTPARPLDGRCDCRQDRGSLGLNSGRSGDYRSRGCGMVSR